MSKLTDRIEHPIPFSGAMVKTLLAGEKTMTRRTIKPQPENVPIIGKDGGNIWHDKGGAFKCRYGATGDILWVREAYTTTAHGVKYRADGEISAVKWKPPMFMPRHVCRLLLKVVDIKVERLRDITYKDILKEGVRIPVNSNRKAMFEIGCKFSPLSFLENYDKKMPYQEACLHARWESLWKTINGEKSWNENPFLWCITFENIIV
jgi:hypothetical protein